ncbi:hypothetical protein RQP46_000898 [Phenoliferia psychrophenolica]
MTSSRTTNSYLPTSLGAPGPSTSTATGRRKLRKEEPRDRGGHVLPLNSGTGYGQTAKTGYVVNGTDVSGNDRHLVPRLQAGIQHVKERRQHARQGDDLRLRGTIIDEDGVAHDSESPAFNPRPMDFTGSLRLPTKAPMSNGSGSLDDSLRTLSVKDSGGGSGYNQFASTRPERLDGTVLDAGVHGMKRSWDGFKLEVKFGARGAGKKLERKLRSVI